MPAKVGFLLSALLHGTAMVMLAFVDHSPPSAPALAGGGGSGTFEIQVGIRLPEGAVQEAEPEMVAVPPLPAASSAPQEPVPAQEPAEDTAAHALEKPEEVAAAESAVEHPLQESEEAAAAAKKPPDAVEPVEARVPVETRPAPETTTTRDAGDELGAVSSVAVATLSESAAAPAPAAGRPSEAGGGPGIEAPGLDDPGALRPVYPLKCRRLGHRGVVVLRVTIGADGSALEVTVLESGGCPDLDSAAVEAVRRARFRPAREWGRAVACTIDQTIRFELRA